MAAPLPATEITALLGQGTRFEGKLHFEGRVRIDGRPVGMMVPGETRDFRVPPGKHRVGLTVDRVWGSRKVALQVREGELAVFTCRPGGGALVLPFAMLCGFFVLVSHSALWGYPLCVVLGMVLVPRRHIRLDGPANYESSLSAGMLPWSASS